MRHFIKNCLMLLLTLVWSAALNCPVPDQAFGKDEENSRWLTAQAASPQRSTPEGGQTRQAKPVSITADKMEVDDDRQVVIFSGAVVSKHEDMILTCDIMKVYYDRNESGDQNRRTTQSPADSGSAGQVGGEDTEIDRIEALGNVKMTRGKEVAQSQRAVYKARSVPRTIVMTGEPRVWRDKDFLTGYKITVYLDENRSVVESGEKERVNAIFYQQPFTKGAGSK